MSPKDFENAVNDAGMPTTESAWATLFNTKLQALNSPYSNTALYSPLLNIIRALLTVPAMLFVQLLIHTWLPNCFVSTAKGYWLELLAKGYGLVKKRATKLRGNITFTRDSTAGSLDIAAGTIVQSLAVNGVVYSLKTMADASFNDGESTINIPCEALEAGSRYNLSDGVYSVLPNAIAGVTVSNASGWLISGGSDDETVEDLRERIANQFNGANLWHTDASYIAICSSFDGVNPRNVFIEREAPRGAGTANAHLLLDVVVASSQLIADIQSEISDKGNHGLGDDVLVMAIPETSHDITLDIWTDSNLSAPEVTALKTNIEQYVRAAFRENNAYSPTVTQPHQRFSYGTLGNELQDTLTDIVDWDFTSATIVNALNIARINTLTVSMNP